jgi:hypothetical protein
MSSGPTSKDEYDQRFYKNHLVSGSGLNTTVHMPCPFCAAPDWSVFPVLETEEVMKGPGATCKECGRSAKFVFTQTANSKSFELVQTGGDAPPSWLPHVRKVDP